MTSPDPLGPPARQPGGSGTAEMTPEQAVREECARIADEVAARLKSDMESAAIIGSDTGAGYSIGASAAAKEIARRIRALPEPSR